MTTYRRTLTCALIAFSALISGVAWGYDPPRELSQFNHKAWLKSDGLPQNSIYALAQTPDGYLWVGTQEGLARFDGLSFRTFSRKTTPGFKGKIVQSLTVSPDSTLWIGTADGAGLYRYRQGEFYPIPSWCGTHWGAITALYSTASGTVWAGTTDGLFEVRGDSAVKRYTMTSVPGRTVVEGLFGNTEGEIFTVGSGFLGVVRDSSIEAFSPSPELPWKVKTARFAADGSLWIGTLDSGLVHRTSDGVHRIRLPGDARSLQITSLEEDAGGSVWAGTSRAGLVRISRGGIESYGAASGLSSDDVNRLLIDREGCVWVGTISGGLNRLKGGAFTTYCTPGQGARNFIFSVYQDRDGRILAGSASGEIFSLRNGKFASEFGNRLPGTILAIHRDRESNLWIGTPQGAYVYRHGVPTGLPLGFVTSIAEDRDGRIWIGSMKGVFGVQPSGRWKPLSLPDSLRPPGVRLMAFDRSGTMWIGTTSNGLLQLGYPARDWATSKTPARPLRWFCPSSGLGSASISSLVEDSEGTFWVGTYGGGMSRIRDGRVVNLLPGGLPEDEIHQIQLDRRGNFWISTNNGVYRIRRDDANAFADGRVTSYAWSQFGASSGMLSDECNGGAQNASLLDRQGRVWFGTASGAVVVDPDSIPAAGVPPAVNIEEIAVGKKRIPAGMRSLSTQEREIEFSYSAVSLGAPEHIRFRFLLEGFDSGWTDAGMRRVATYTNLAPGSYTFRVQAANADGSWNTVGAAFRFVIEPRWYQTWWFWSIVAGLGLCAGLAVHLWYRRDRDRQLVSAQLESRLAQARLQVLEMQLQPHFLFNTLNGISVLVKEDPDKAGKMINRLSDFLRLTLERSGVQEITLQEELHSVDRYLQIELLRFADRLDVQYDIAGDLADAMVPAMILQPIVENAIRHGVSKRRGHVTIRIAAARSNGSVRLDVSDDGAGLDRDPAAVTEGVGLSNTRARLRQLYGAAHHFELMRPSTGGVTVEVTLPFHKEPVETWNRHLS
jgi:ligand-binding sensor domain-containing protein